MSVRILAGDCRDSLRSLSDESVHVVVTSPPYWGLRDYRVEPQVWGGEPSCPHEWLDVPRRAANTQGESGDRAGRGNTTAQASRGHGRGGFCRGCSAWRGSLGLEPDYRMYVDHMVEVFREVRRVLRADGTLWLNLGDSYATGAGAVGERPGGGAQGDRWSGYMAGGTRANRGQHLPHQSGKAAPRIEAMGPVTQPNRMPQPGLKAKDLCGIPWRVAFALQDDGWWLRQDIIWSKPNPMPESVRDRCTKAHEYLFLLSKRERYYFDQEAILEPCSPNTHARLSQDVQAQIGSACVPGKPNGNMKAVGRHLPGNKSHKGTTAYLEGDERHRTKAGLVEYAQRQRKLAEAGSGIKNNDSMNAALAIMPKKRNRRSVWEITTQPFSDAHFATFPSALVEPCILAGSSAGGTVLDPFFGAGTTGLAADRLGRNCIGIELNPEYAEMARRRIKRDAGLFAEIA